MSKVSVNSQPSLSSRPVDMRDAFFDALYEIALQNRNLILLTDDQGAFSLEKFKKDLEGQYFNIGIAEQNMVSVAAGLALLGKRPFLYGISTFMTMRCYEQIRVDLCCMNLPVAIIGSGPGYTYGSDGPTHHATQDVALMRTLPEMSIYNPSDDVMTEATAKLAFQNTGPTYVRLEKGVFPRLYCEGHNFLPGFHILREGQDGMLISTGVMIHSVLKVAERLSKYEIEVGVIDLYRVKPVDSKQLMSHLSSFASIVTIEETSASGGLGSLIGELLLQQEQRARFMRLTAPDEHIYNYGNREWLHTLQGLDEESLINSILKWLRK